MTELEQTLKDLEQGKISADHAEAVILRLFSASGSFTAYDMERAYDDGYSTEGEVTFDIENYR